ncbi:MAG: pteridine reductase [Thiolinea sp.]
MKENNLTGKVALVTGGARRIGAAIVRVLHEAGATVAVHYHSSSDEAHALQAELNQQRENSCFLVQGELLDITQHKKIVAEVLRKAGRLDILVNNASRFYPTPLAEMTEQQWDELNGINMKVPLFMAQAAQQALCESKGCIINMVDVHGMRPLENHVIYSAAKAGLVMLTQALAREMGPCIRVNGIAPGAILWPEQGMSSEQQQELLAKTVLRCPGNVEDVSRMALFLAKDADYITGQIFPVDGGRLLNH